MSTPVPPARKPATIPPARPPAPVLAAFGMAQAAARLVTDNPKKSVWRLDHGGRTSFLKQMPYSAPRVKFIVAATRHLAARGVPTPQPQTTVDGEPYAAHDDRCYLLHPEVRGEAREKFDLRRVARILGRFHQASEGFQAPADAAPQSALGSWPYLLRKRANQFTEFEQAARARPTGAFERAFLEAVSRMRAVAEDCLAALEDGPYARSTEAARQAGLLCHQDFAPSNLIEAPDGTVWVIDLDSVEHDVPARDLRKLMNKLMKKKGRWDAAVARGILAGYQEVRPLSDDDIAVVWLDARFPHLFSGIANKYFTRRGDEGWSESKFVSRLREMIAFEDSKAGGLPAPAGKN